MDALSTLLRHAQHLSGTKYYSLEVTGNWSYSITSENKIYFYLVLANSFCIDIEGVSHKVYAGDMIMIPNSHKHICYVQGHHGDDAEPLDEARSSYDQGFIKVSENNTLDAHFIVVECQYDLDITRSLFSVLPAMLPAHSDMPESRFATLNGAVGLITQESDHDRLGRRAIINLWANIVMIECLRTYIENLSETTDSWLVAMKDRRLSKVLAVMHETPNYNWTTYNLAEVAGMSRSSFTERFKNIVGVPPLTYLTDYRLRIAARHLRLQHYRIGQISELVGYASNSTFSQAFKRLYELSPREYRQQYQDDQRMA